MLRVWNLTLIVSTFALTILGTFLTRSGILSSVHAFTNGNIGYYFLSFIALVLVLSLMLLLGRSSELSSAGNLDNPVSRETAFLLNNLLFTVFTFTVLLGTLFPLVAEAVRGVKVSVGAPFFNKMTVPLCAALLFLVGVGPVLPWRGTSLQHLQKRLRVPGIAALVCAIAALLVGARNVYALLAFAFGGFALVCNVDEFIVGARARVRAQGESFLRALGQLFVANNRRYGGYVAHIGVIVLALGITASSTFTAEKQQTLRPGESLTVGDYTVRFNELRGRDEPHRFVVEADVTVLTDGKERGRLDPRLNYYKVRDEPVPTPAVRSRAVNDLYINLLAFEQQGEHATLHVLVEPLVIWIWIGGLVVFLGALIGVLPLKKQVKIAVREPPKVAAA